MKKNYSLDWEDIKGFSKKSLIKIGKTYARAVNRRVENLLASERKRSEAYKRDIESSKGAAFLYEYKGKSKTMKGVLRAKVSEHMSIEELRESLRIFEKFLTSKTSTSEGIKDTEKKKLENAKELLGSIEDILPESEQVNKITEDQTLRDFLEFLGTEAKSAIANKADSDIVVLAISYAYNKNGRNKNALKEAYEEHVKSGQTFEEWLRKMGYDEKGGNVDGTGGGFMQM